MLGILKSNETQKDQLILACQYRPPVRSFVLEFPAGLMDVGESPSQSGLRELYEETYVLYQADWILCLYLLYTVVIEEQLNMNLQDL